MTTVYARSMSQSRFLILCFIAFGGSAACSPSSSNAVAGDAGDAGGGPPIPATGPIPEAIAPAAIAQAICGKVTSCGCDWTKSAPCQMDQHCTAADCLSAYTARYQDANTQSGSRGEVYDPQGARTCVDAINAADCHDVDYINLCTVVWNGTQAFGQPCSPTQACRTTTAAPATCDSTGKCAVKSTEPAHTGPAMGAACSGTCQGNTCDVVSGVPGGACQHASGLACIGATCQPLLALGSSCNGAFQCANPQVCIAGACSSRLYNGSSCVASGGDEPCQIASGCVRGACMVLAENGQPCTDSAECLTNDCAAGLCEREGAAPICGM